MPLIREIRYRYLQIKEYFDKRDGFIYKISAAFYCALFLLGLLYRLRLYYMLIVDTGFTVSQTPSLLFITGLFNEILFTSIISLILFAILVTINHKTGKKFLNPGKMIIISVASLLIFSIAFLYNSSYHFWVSMNTGLTRDLLLEAAATTPFREAVKFLKPVDVLLIGAPMAVLLLSMSISHAIIWTRRIFLFTAPIMILLAVPVSFLTPAADENTMSKTPVRYTLASFFETSNWNVKDPAGNAGTSKGDQMRSIQFIDPRFIRHENVPVAHPLSMRNQTRWNVLYIVMESIGREYVFNTENGNPMPMPFLFELKQKGLFLDNHYSVGNTSPRSLFSMLSGLYPSPRVQMFCTKPDIVVPSLKTFLGDEYDAFLVTPGSLDWFFPKGFMQNSGFNELLGYKEVPGRVIRDTYGKNDIDVVDFFIKRLKQTGNKPFLAVYYSFAAHWPYVDFGEEYRIFKNTENRLSRYYNNINMLDHQIKKIFDYLNESGHIDNTIVVILGDHGEAFGQHPGVWVHSRDSYKQNFMVPALLYQPRLFSPRRITVPTTHTDIVPTLLDAMRIGYNRRLIQGESLLNRELKRKYIFLFGNENTLTTIGDNIKLQYSFRDKKCWAFNLANDPGEKTKLSGEGYEAQNEAMMYYHQYQFKVLEEYNESLQKGLDFYGERHYSVK